VINFTAFGINNEIIYNEVHHVTFD
jgi:hypothetical protein